MLIALAWVDPVGKYPGAYQLKYSCNLGIISMPPGHWVWAQSSFDHLWWICYEG